MKILRELFTRYNLQKTLKSDLKYSYDVINWSTDISSKYFKKQSTKSGMKLFWYSYKYAGHSKIIFSSATNAGLKVSWYIIFWSKNRKIVVTVFLSDLEWKSIASVAKWANLTRGSAPRQIFSIPSNTLVQTKSPIVLD